MMKKYLMLMPMFIVVLIASCVKSDSDVVVPNCTPALLPEQIRSVNVVDPKNTATNSPVVAVFKLSQILQSYQGTQCENRIPNCTVNLLVKNTTSKKIQFDYTVNYLCGTNTWEYQGYSIIEPNGVDNVGIISRNCGWITGGNVVISMGNIFYP
jgi:hypothetical protein